MISHTIESKNISISVDMQEKAIEFSIEDKKYCKYYAAVINHKSIENICLPLSEDFEEFCDTLKDAPTVEAESESSIRLKWEYELRSKTKHFHIDLERIIADSEVESDKDRRIKSLTARVYELEEKVKEIDTLKEEVKNLKDEMYEMMRNMLVGYHSKQMYDDKYVDTYINQYESALSTYLLDVKLGTKKNLTSININGQNLNVCIFVYILNSYAIGHVNYFCNIHNYRISSYIDIANRTGITVTTEIKKNWLEKLSTAFRSNERCECCGYPSTARLEHPTLVEYKTYLKKLMKLIETMRETYD